MDIIGCDLIGVGRFPCDVDFVTFHSWINSCPLLAVPLSPDCLMLPLGSLVVQLDQITFHVRSSSSSLNVVVRWRHLCLTAPSKYSGHPTGMSESSRHPSPFCSMTVPRRGTSTVVLRLIYGRLQCHVSGARRPRLATSARASNLGWLLRGIPLLWPISL